MASTAPQTGTPAVEADDDWDLPGQACMIGPDGSIDPECEACQ